MKHINSKNYTYKQFLAALLVKDPSVDKELKIDLITKYNLPDDILL